MADNKNNRNNSGNKNPQGGNNRQNNHNNHNQNYARPYAFVNPYNFIPLREKVSSTEKSEKKYTGVIEYSLKTITPLFIPNTSNDDAFCMQKKYPEHKSYDFFSYKDLSGLQESVKAELPHPVIPGSEMRGMLRSNYEILTNSCMSAVDDDALLSKRTQEKFGAGLLKRCVKGETVTYRLIKVKDDCLLRTMGKNSLVDDLNSWDDLDENGNRITGKKEWGRQCYIQGALSEGEKVTFTYQRRTKGKPLALNVRQYQKGENKRSVGYILKGEKGPAMIDKDTGLPSKQNKHCAHVFREPADIQQQVVSICKKEEFSEEYLTSILDNVLDIYDKNNDGAYKEYAEQYQEFKKGNGNQFFPVYYSMISYGGSAEVLFLSPACITREVYTRKLSDMSGDKRTCEKSGGLCPACALFGTFRDNKAEESIASRIRVTDLECFGTDPNCLERKQEDLEIDLEKCFDKEPVTLQTLSQPKFNPEFYMEKPDEDAVFWTYEYYVDSEGNVHENTAGVNGRKFYWHHADFQMGNCTAKPCKLNKTIRPLRRGVYFKGKIYFENLSKKELNTLCYMVNAGEDKNIALDKKKHGYKLGAAKPLGFGSVVMHADQVLLREIERTEDCQILLKETPYKPDSDKTLVDSGAVSDFKKMTNLKILKGKKVSYPRREEGGDIFEWFVQNHVGYGYSKQERKYVKSKMPQSRDKMLFDRYLEPMTPETVSTKWKQKVLR